MSAAPLICPQCGAPLERAEASFRCTSSHSFDVAREGYVNLASPRATRKASDTRAMVEARLRFLEAGFYDPLAERLASLAEDQPGAIVDVGCGPAFYLQRALTNTERPAVGIDLSKTAIKRAARALPNATFAVADVEEGIPIASASAGIVLSVFAPRPPVELRRIVHPDGKVIVAAAGPGHLGELRHELNLLSVPEDKEASLKERLRTHFDIETVERLRFTLDLSAEAAADLVAMGPNAWHRDESSKSPVATRTTAAILLLVALPR